MKLNLNNFTSRVWWTLSEEIALCAKEMAGEKEMACCVRGYHIYDRGYVGDSNWGRLVWRCYYDGKFFVGKLHFLCSYENIFTTKKSELL